MKSSGQRSGLEFSYEQIDLSPCGASSRVASQQSHCYGIQICFNWAMDADRQ